MVTRVFLGVFAPGTPGLYKDQKCSDGKGDDDDGDGAEIVDDIAADQQAEYRIRASKWVASSLVCVQDHMFWYILSASYKARAPVRHLFHILSKYSLQRNKASPIPVSELPVVDLVTKRLDQLDTEFRKILQSVSSWSNELIDDLQWMVELTGKPINVERGMLHSISTQLVLHNWAGFRRRVVNMFSGYLVCTVAMWD